MILTVQQATSYASAAGFSGNSLQIIVAIAQAESGLDTQATNTAGNSAGVDRGILQINSYYHPEVTDAQAFDPAQAFVAGYAISKQGTDFTPWSTYNSGAYQQFMSTPSTSVHWQQPGLLALPETDGHGDTCGPIVILDYLALSGHALSISALDAYRQQLINQGLMDSAGEVGMTLSQINQALLNAGVQPVKFVGYTSSLDFATFHNDLKQAMLNHQLVIFETSNASALPDGQAGVQYHFVLCGGIDSSLGYFTCNGDTYTALKSSTPVSPVWYGIGSIQASAPCGYIILPAVSAPSPSGGSSMSVPAGWTDDGSYLHNPVNSFVVGHGFRAHILTNAWDPTDVPLCNEFSVAQPFDYTELGNQSLGTGNVQYFRLSQLSWASPAPSFADQNGVWRTWVGQEAMVMRQMLTSQQSQISNYASQIANLNSQVTSLQSQLASSHVDPAVKSALQAAVSALAPLAQAIDSLSGNVAKL